MSEEEIRAIINSYQSFKYEPEKDAESLNCAVCIDALVVGSMVKGLQCGHKFHPKCINEWLKIKLQCPLCKNAVTA